MDTRKIMAGQTCLNTETPVQEAARLATQSEFGVKKSTSPKAMEWRRGYYNGILDRKFEGGTDTYKAGFNLGRARITGEMPIAD